MAERTTIYLDDAINLLEELETKRLQGDVGLLYAPMIKGLKALPSAQQERETAKFIRWMECKKTAKYISYTPHCKCSKCGTEFLIEIIKYCYMCGARMEEEK